MILLDLYNQGISKVTGMYLDKVLEQQFQESYLNRYRNHLRNIALIIGILFFSFLISDFVLNKTSPAIIILFLCRFTFLVMSLLFYFKPDYFLKSYPFMKITIYKLLAIILFFIIVLNYENPNFILQAFAINVIILGVFFFVPNMQPNKIMISIFTYCTFLIITLTKYHPSFLEGISVFVYLLVGILLCGISSYSIGKYQRLDFANKQYLVKISRIDPLTNIYNRLQFNESLSYAIDLSRRYGDPFSLIMFDIDHFKQLNDFHGHIFGDQVLIELTKHVKNSIREVDIFARWGGEEFVILLPHISCKDASVLAERLRKSICSELLKKEIALTCSFGVTSLSIQDNEDSIMNRVDMALYKAKKGGRNMSVTEARNDNTEL